MPCYLRRPTVVQAEQWFPNKEVEAQAQIYCSDDWWIITSSGAALPLSPGDWLVSDPDGLLGYVPVPDAVFRSSYEPVEDSETEDLRWDAD
jgi:hypothetical protein